MPAFQVISLLTAGALLSLGWIAWKVRNALRMDEVDSNWWENFSCEKYRMMPRLMDARELQFLREQPGCDRKMLERFRAERARICLEFLWEMKADFRRLQAVGQALVVAGRCSAGLPDQLFRHRLRFSVGWWRARAGLLAWRLGLPEPDLTGLVEALESSARQVRLSVAPVA